MAYLPSPDYVIPGARNFVFAEALRFDKFIFSWTVYDKPFAIPKEFATALGYFHGVFAILDLTTDFAIYKLLNVTPNEARVLGDLQV